jgi:hypothetical protein
LCALGRPAEAPASGTMYSWSAGEAGSTPAGRSSVMIGDRLVVGFLALNQATEVQVLLPELVPAVRLVSVGN